MTFFRSIAHGLGFGAAGATAGRATESIIGAAAGNMAGAATGAATSAAVPLVQQGVSALNSRNDESVILALLSQLRDDPDDTKPAKMTAQQKRTAWQNLNKGLSNNRVSELRKIIVNLTLPERFESFMHEEQEPVQSQQNQQNNQQGNQSKGGPKNRVRKFTRVAVDYELVTDPNAKNTDYRIAMIESLVHMTTAEAIAFVESMISELSLAEKAGNKIDKFGNELFRFVAASRLGDRYKDTMSTKEIITALKQLNKRKKTAFAAEKNYSQDQKRRKLLWNLAWGALAVLLIILSVVL